jgi:hypothetical protein
MPPPEAAPRATRSPAWMAELALPAAELRRLRHAAMRVKSRTKVGGTGVTREVVEKIREKWRTEEVVRARYPARLLSTCASSTRYSRCVPVFCLNCVCVACIDCVKLESNSSCNMCLLLKTVEVCYDILAFIYAYEVHNYCSARISLQENPRDCRQLYLIAMHFVPSGLGICHCGFVKLSLSYKYSIPNSL